MAAIYGKSLSVIQRIRARKNDAPLPTEYLLDDAADLLESWLQTRGAVWVKNLRLQVEADPRAAADYLRGLEGPIPKETMVANG